MGALRKLLRQASEGFLEVSTTKWRRCPPIKRVPPSDREQPGSLISLSRRTFPSLITATSFRRLDVLHLRQQLDEFLFALRLVLARLRFRHLSDVHRAEFRTAPRAELRLFVKIIAKIFVVHGLRGQGLKGQLVLLVPIKQ